MNLFTQNLANHFSILLNRLEEPNKGKSIPVTDAETSKPSWSKAIVNNSDTQGSLSKLLLIIEMRTKKNPNKHSLAVNDGEKLSNKGKRPLSSLEANKKHSDNSSSKYKADSGGNASHSNDDDNNEINVNKSNMISIPDPEYNN